MTNIITFCVYTFLLDILVYTGLKGKRIKVTYMTEFIILRDMYGNLGINRRA